MLWFVIYTTVHRWLLDTYMIFLVLFTTSPSPPRRPSVKFSTKQFLLAVNCIEQKGPCGWSLECETMSLLLPHNSTACLPSI